MTPCSEFCGHEGCPNHEGDRMSFRERLIRFWSVVCVWALGRRACHVCGYGVLPAGLTGEEIEIPEEVCKGVWVHESCGEYGEAP